MNDEKKEIDTYTDIQILALNNIVHPTEDSFFRKLCRWYSKTFYTPLNEVEEKFSLEELLIVKYEDHYESLSGEELTKVKQQLLYGKKPVDAEDEDNEFFEKMQLDILKRQQKELDEKNAKKVAETMPNIEVKF